MCPKSTENGAEEGEQMMDFSFGARAEAEAPGILCIGRREEGSYDGL